LNLHDVAGGCERSALEKTSIAIQLVHSCNEYGYKSLLFHWIQFDSSASFIVKIR
jgi:hypothetical protein